MNGALTFKNLGLYGLIVVQFLGGVLSIFGADTSHKRLNGHVPSVVAHLSPQGNYVSSRPLSLAIGLLPKDEKGLDAYLAELYDPASPNYRHFLTPSEYAERFGPSQQDYQKLIQFAQANGLKVTKTYPNRLVLDVSGPVESVQKAFRINLRTYRHPSENRNFFAPDSEPLVAADLPVADIQGLSDYGRPHPKFNKRAVARAATDSGNAPDGSGEYFGDDFRNAYVPGTGLTGAGQSIGLFQADGFYASDIAAYATAAGGGRTNIPIQTVLLDGFSGTPTTGSSSGNPEVSLDIEMAMSMAPGLSQIIVFEGNLTNFIPNDILSAMASSNTVKNLSSSWGWSGGPTTTTDNIFKNMALQGQSFFSASGDSDAFPNDYVDTPAPETTPSSCPYITQVGGTTLTTSGATYSSETVWNWGLDNGNYVGTSGGISSYYAIPTWQQGINSLLTNGGSTTNRNIPDVALTADNVYVQYGDGSTSGFGGTSCAAPLWAGFMALVNQQLVANSGVAANSIGFVNPAVYELAKESIYSSVFHDVTTGNNTWPSSTNEFYATPGYDLCTGLGTPAGTNLINALVNPDPLVVVSNTGFNAIGSPSGVFSISSQTFYLTNTSTSSLSWAIINTSAWLSVSSSTGTLAAGAGGSVVVSLSNTASNLAAGFYTANLWFTNVTSGVAHSRLFTLSLSDSLSVLPINGFVFAGAGGSFSSASQAVILTNTGPSSLNWGLNNTSTWFMVSPLSGTMGPGGQATVSITLTATASNLPTGIYIGTLQVTNLADQYVHLVTGTIEVGQSIVQNGGFETGDFTDWNLTGGGYPTNFVDSGTFITPHSGAYAAALGQYGSAGSLTQTLATVPGQKYLLSLWLENPESGSREQFSVVWNGTTLYSVNNPAASGWNNLQYVVSATSTSTTLKFGERNDPYYFGLDDVSVTPGFAPSITTPPTNQTVLAGSNASFSVVSTGSTPITYQWRLNGTNLANGTGISGVNSNVLALSAVTANLSGGNYTVVITNLFGSVTSSPAMLTVGLLKPTLALSSPENPAGFHDQLSFGATLTPNAATGTVQFYTNGVVFDTETLTAGAAASAAVAVLPRGTNLVAAIYSGDANYQPATNALQEVVTNHPPMVINFSTNRYAGLPLSLPVSALAADWSDVDGDTVTLAGVGTSTNGVSLTIKSGLLIYVNTNNVSDQFVCVVTDGWGGTNFQTVNLSVVPLPADAIPNISGLSQSGGKVSLNLAGAAGFTYVLQSTSDLTAAGGWQPVATNMLGTNGLWQFVDTITNHPQQFYRLQLVQ